MYFRQKIKFCDGVFPAKSILYAIIMQYGRKLFGQWIKGVVKKIH